MSTSQTLDAASIRRLIEDNQRLSAENAQLKRSKEKFGLSFKRYPEQGEAELIYDGKVPYLVKKPEYSTIKDTPQNGEHLLLEGDNLSALIALQSTHKGKVDVIYIDPPYNTGRKDFVYNDSYVSNDDGFRHSKWLSFMERRLVLAQELLSETGVIFISIDDNEHAALKLLMDSVFGEANFVANMIWKKKQGGGNDSSNFVTEHEYVLAYGKDGFKSLLDTEHEIDVKQYPYEDEHGRYNLIRLDKSSLPYVASLDFEITDREGNKYRPRIYKGKQSRWRWSKKKVEADFDDLVFRNGGVYTKSYLPIQGIKPKTLLVSPRFGRTETGNDDIKSTLGRGKFSFPKPVVLIQHLLRVSSSKNSIILDFFAGSGTTGHAVAALNAEDGGNRQCILVTNNFEQDGSPNGIARDVTAKRMEAVLTGKWADGREHEALPGNLHYYQIEFADPAASYDAMDSWADKYAGLASVAENSYRDVQWRGIATTYPALSEALKNGDATLTVNVESTKAVLVWQDESVMDEGNERVEEVTQEASEWAGQHDVRLIFYVPSSEGDYIPDDDFFEFDNSAAKPFPLPYIDSVNGVVKTLKGQGLLVPGEAINDSDGDESRPDPQELEEQ